MPSGSDRTVKVVGNLLIAASLIFFLETAFEMYFLTLTQGQQMLDFSLVHIAPPLAILVVSCLELLFFVWPASHWSFKLHGSRAA
jgi:TRAP-type C4-dicarboxylate transport system permease small subunit